MVKIKKRNYIAIILVFIACMTVSVLTCVYKVNGIMKDSYENDDRVVAALISNVIDNNFLRPITVAETISKDFTTKKILDIHSKEEAQKIEKEAADYLKSLRDGFGYSMVFAVSDPAKTYFTYNGISKFMDIENDEHDIWYKIFIESGKKYDLDVDTDEAANWSLSVFINTAVYDENRFLGVCGVGVDMTELQKLLERYERIYDVKIDLIDQDGLIQVDMDTKRIEKDFIEIEDLINYSDGEYYYEILPEGNRIITYLKNLDWYLVVQQNRTLLGDINSIVLPCVISLAVGIIALLVFGKLGIKE